MNWDDDDDFISDDDFLWGDHSNDEDHSKIDSHPLYILATEIFESVDALIACSNRSEYDFFKQDIHRSADLLIIKFEEAMTRKTWINAMECAALIRHEASMLMAQTGLMENFLDAEKQYVKILRDELIRFRSLFNDWVMEIQDFDHEDYEDEWGLFVRGKM
jgi:hypothetical protein